MAKGNCTKEADGKIAYKTVSKPGSPPAELDSSRWYMDKCKIVGYGGEHLTIKVNQDGIIRVDGNYNDGKASRTFFNEYIIPDGVEYDALEFRIYEGDVNTLVIVGSFGSQDDDQLVSSNTSSTITRTENVKISSTFTETFESTELEGSEDMSKEISIVDNKFEAKVNVSEYKSEEVHVKISRKTVLIYTSRKEVTKTSTRSEIKKTFEIPAGVKPESITSVVGKDGNLTVSATVDTELAKRQTQQLQQTSANEVIIRIRRVNTTKTVTGQDLKDVKINRDRFEMNVDLREYQLEEVTVKIIKTRRVITITANHKSQFESYSSTREFSLPAGAPDSNPNAIDAVLSPNGILTITGPCTPQTTTPALTDVTDDTMNKLVKQQQQNTAIQQQQEKNTSVQRQDTSVQEVRSEQQVVQQSRYTKITRETFTSSTMTSLDITDETEDEPQPLITAPDTPIDDVTQDMAIDQDGNYVVDVNIKDFTPEEITIKASKATITIVGQKSDDKNRQFVKTIRVPIDVVVTPDKIRSIFDRSRRVITIIITKKTTVTKTTTKQVTDDTTEEEIDDRTRNVSPQQQRQQVLQKQENVQENQTKIQTQQQKQKSIEETHTEVHSQQVHQQKQVQQRQVQQKQESIEETEVQTQQQINQQRQVQQKQESVQDTQTRTQQQVNQQKQTNQQIQKQDQRQQNVTNTTTTSKRTIKTTTTSVETLLQQGYNFDSATSQVYTGDPKCFERATQVVDYKPEEVEVKIAMPWVIVEGKQEMTAENGWRSKQFTKMFTVPEGVKLENIHLEWNDAGDVVNCTALIG